MSMLHITLSSVKALNSYPFAETAVRIYNVSAFRRTHITFSGTVYELSRIWKLIFGVILFVLITVSFVNIYILFNLDSLEGEEWNQWFTVLLALAGLWFLLYALSAVVSVYLFQSHLVSLVRKQSNCIYDVTKNMELTERQQSMVALASYVTNPWLQSVVLFESPILSSFFL